MLPTESLKGRQFGRLRAISFAGYFAPHLGSCRQAYWTCRCKCGAVVRVRANSLKSGRTRSCGCLRKYKDDELLAMTKIAMKS